MWRRRCCSASATNRHAADQEYAIGVPQQGHQGMHGVSHRQALVHGALLQCQGNIRCVVIVHEKGFIEPGKVHGGRFSLRAHRGCLVRSHVRPAKSWAPLARQKIGE